MISKQIVKEPSIDIKIKKEIFQKLKWEEILKGRNIFQETIRIDYKSDISKLPFTAKAIGGFKAFQQLFL